MSFHNLTECDRGIARKSKELENFKRKSILEATDAYNSSISILTAELSILKLESCKIKRKQEELILNQKQKQHQEIITKIQNNINRLINREEELRRKLTEKISIEINTLINEWENNKDTFDKDLAYTRGKTLINILNESRNEKNVLRNTVLNYQKKIERLNIIENYNNTFNTILTKLDNLEALNQYLIFEVDNFLSDIDNIIAADIYEKSKFECCICQDEISSDDTFLIIQCGHKLCRTCAKGSFDNAMKQRQLPPPCPKCSIDPCEKCPVNKGNSSKKSKDKYCTISDIDFQTLLNDEEWIKYQNAMVNQIALNDPKHYLKCPNDECKMIIYKDDNDGCHIICPKCHHEWCSNCNVDWHKEMTCDEYQKWRKNNEKEDETFEQAKRRGLIRKCPGCKNYGLKAGGCNTATCHGCGKVFQWNTA